MYCSGSCRSAHCTLVTGVLAHLHTHTHTYTHTQRSAKILKKSKSKFHEAVANSCTRHLLNYIPQVISCTMRAPASGDWAVQENKFDQCVGAKSLLLLHSHTIFCTLDPFSIRLLVLCTLVQNLMVSTNVGVLIKCFMYSTSKLEWELCTTKVAL